MDYLPNTPYFAVMKMRCILLVFSLCLTFDVIQAQRSVAAVLNDRVATGEAGLIVVIDQPSPVVGCGEPVTLTATITGALEISWKRNGEFITGATTNTFVANQSGVYTVVVVSLLCQLESAPVEVILESPLSAEILSPEGTSACQGDSVLLQATGGNAEWQWYREGEPINGAVTAAYSATLPGSYVVVGNASSICASSSPPVQVTLNALPDVSLVWESNPVICSGDSLAVLAALEPGEVLTWYHDEEPVAVAGTIYYASLAGEYHAEVFNTLSSCSAVTGSIYLEVLPEQAIVVESAGNASVCEGQSATLLLSEGDGTIQWFTNDLFVEGANATVLTTFSTGIYSAQVTDFNGCVSTSNAIAVEINSLPSVDFVIADGPAVLCGPEDTVWVELEVGNTYTWYNGETVLSDEVSNSLTITAIGDYTVQVANAAGCTAISELLSVQAFDIPLLDLLPGGTVNLCDGQILFFEAIAELAVNYGWYYNGEPIDGEFGTAIEVMDAGEYAVIVLDENGCSAVSSAQVELISVATPVIVDGGVTPEGQLLLTDNASGHQWYLNGQEISGATGNSYVATEDGTYTCIAIEDICESTLSAGFDVVLGGVLEGSIAMKLYPNPAEDFIVFESSLLTVSTFSIYDVAGRKVLSGLTTNARMSVDVSSLNAGLYRLVLGEGVQAAFSVVR
jgi:hypothetical protein